MSMNPGLIEQLVAGRRADLEHAAGGQRQRKNPALEDGAAAPTHRTRPALARRLGVLLIAVGRRLADSDRLPAAFEGSRRP